MKRIVLSGLIIIIFLMAGAGAGLALYVVKALEPMPPSAEAQRISFPPGTGVAQLALELEQKGIVRNARIFTWYLKYKREGARFQAGEYDMTPGISPDEIIGQLNRGETVKEAGLRLTVPEGFTLRQIAEKLEAEHGMDSTAFLQAAQSYKAAEGTVGASIPEDASIRYRLEGYLFPETYEWKKDADANEMIASMMQELDKRLAQLPKDWKEVMAQRNLTFHQMLTIASLIEREVVVDEERPIVSGIIHNRLKQGMPLQIDATVQYLFDKQRERLLFQDLLIESPYNTYLNKGLPPGPIASPSLASIQAAIYPAETNYLFYVTKKDGTRRHLFAETFEQHNKNIAESNKTGNP
ncbi:MULTISPECIES: endolytic transglycosylase MltG [unclassified Paenibacillus]|uniref:endolytic transglycosylase MltG n=1 Tax=unclassified Paenibacillus TaxID=185978 RepID=UPI00211988CA|nr:MULTISPECIES: endolytic transglycosylase MltG [unclassified Paenibacillus]